MKRIIAVLLVGVWLCCIAGCKKPAEQEAAKGGAPAGDMKSKMMEMNAGKRAKAQSIGKQTGAK